MSQGSRSCHQRTRTEQQTSQGASIGNWRVVELLAEGPWSRVYRARPQGAGDPSASDYAVKVARPPDARGDQQGVAAALIRREAHVGRAVAHRHLTSILSSHVAEAPHYVVMPYLEGATLEEALEAVTAVPLAHGLWILRQTAQAVQALHRAGWLHSDIKPDNIFVSPNGHVTLLDLGLARRIDRAECAPDAPFAGTLAYAAPESFSTIDGTGPASDIYSLGITLFRTLTGALPFAGDEPEELAEAHLHRTPPDPRRFNPTLPGRVVRLLRRMLAKQPERRPAAAELIAWLADLEIDVFDDRCVA